MKLVSNILAAVDFRESSDNIINNSILFAKKLNAKLTFIHVLPEDIKHEKVRSLVEKAAVEQLDKIENRAQNEGIEVAKSILKFGKYSEKIVLAAEETDANLVIIGSGEKKKEDSFQLGTTAGKIMRKSVIPVFVIKNNQDLSTVNNILCPVDFSEESNNALKNAIAIARLFNSKLHILSIYTPFTQTVTRIDPAEENRQRKEEQALELKRFLRHKLIDLNYETEIRGGDPAEEILDAIEKNNTDLLLMGTTGKSGISKILMGSVAEKVTREVSCSFITSKKADFLTFEIKTKNLEEHFSTAETFYEKGFYHQAIRLYNAALELNFSHLPSLRGLAKTYEKLGNTNKANEYQGMVDNIIEQFQHFKKTEGIKGQKES